ncbi:MAG: helix-turn-helix domain-containing protein [Armatimonadetes bacterium]|nr:helix-turn-helix domain-containing protein [Candidatus Latescibacterota bacterium]NIO76787.1 helix-turn-helix domain-containing protein [Armatimonadota bacterium]NIO78667.1 helix-turn-helix domain-containing protein [Candidatus Latescibacterota bacterium]
MESREKKIAVQRMKDYIEEHIAEPITLRMLADSANYSPWHAARIFKEVTGKTPFEYVRAVRLSRAAAQLRDTNAKIVDVAFDFVFGSHEGFTRAFSKQFGMTPQHYRKNAPLIKFFVPKPSRGYHLTSQRGENIMSEDSNTIFIQVVDRPARKLILKRGKKATQYFEYTDEVGCDVFEAWWEALGNIKEALYEPIGVWLPENLCKPDTSIYAPAVEVPADFTGEIPEGFEIIDLPPCKMMVFQGPPYEDVNDNYAPAGEKVKQAMRNYNPTIQGFEWADQDGPRFQLAPMGYRGYIEARPVRQLNVK